MLRINDLGIVERSVGSICHSRRCHFPVEPGIRRTERSTGCGGFATASLLEIYQHRKRLLTRSRYLSQVRQELAMRLLARVYADSNTPSKVGVLTLSLRIRSSIKFVTVVAEFYEAQIHG